MSEEYFKWVEGDYTIKLEYDPIDTRFEDEFEQMEDDSAVVCSLYHRTSIVSMINLWDSYEELKAWHKKHPEYELLRLLRYEHSGVALRAFELDEQPGYPFNCQWDSGMEGFVLAKPVDGEAPVDVANRFLDYLNSYLNGECYGYIIEDEDGNELDSCWGFIGYENAKQGAVEAVHAIEGEAQYEEAEAGA